MIGIALITSLDISMNREYMGKSYYFRRGEFEIQLNKYNENLIAYIGNKYINDNTDVNIEYIKEYLDSVKSFKYYIVSGKSNEVYTNISGKVDLQEYIKKNGIYEIKYPTEYISNQEDYEINDWFAENNLLGRIIFVYDKDDKSQVSKDYQYFLSIRERLLKEREIGTFLFIIGVSILIYLMIKRKVYKYLEWIIQKYNNIFLEIRLIVLILMIEILKIYISVNSIFSININIRQFIAISTATVIVIMIVMVIINLFQYVKNKKLGLLQEPKSIFYKIYVNQKFKFHNATIKNKIILINLINIISGMVIFILLSFIIYSRNFYMGRGISAIAIVFLMCILIYGGFIFRASIKNAVLLDNIIDVTKEMSEGNLDTVVKEDGGDKSIGELVNNINNMRNAFKESIDKQIKSERLKTELITNVSHDLKTPLTSIINYVKLLNKEDIKKEELEHYADVLNKKTYRLKILVEDLFEMAKLSSGAIELNIEQMDICSILRQALGEFYQELDDGKVIFKVNIPKDKIILSLDGMRTWRVFENLIGNILKYSQENTRAYIDLEEDKEEVTITMKNIASYEMNFDPNEIYERFKRGDSSRTTDGSGLGLAIAKNIVELEGGTMDIVVDGDLFKVIIRFKKNLISE